MRQARHGQRANPTMAAHQLPDLDELMIELVQLNRRDKEAARRLESGRERAAAFPSEFRDAEVRKLDAAHRTIRSRIDEIEASLLPLHRTPEGL